MIHKNSILEIKEKTDAVLTIWGDVVSNVHSNEWDSAVVSASHCKVELLSVGSISLAGVIDSWIGAASNEFNRHLAVYEMDRISFEIEWLCCGVVRPTSCFFELVSKLSPGKKINETGFFLPFMLPVIDETPRASIITKESWDINANSFSVDLQGKTSSLLKCLGEPEQAKKIIEDVLALVEAVKEFTVHEGLSLCFDLTEIWIRTVLLSKEFEFSKDDALILARIKVEVKKSTKEGWSFDASVASSLSFKIANLNLMPASRISERFDLRSLLKSRTEKKTPLFSLHELGLSWFDASEKWDEYLSGNRINPSELKSALVTLKESCKASWPMFSMALDAIKVFSLIENSAESVPDSDKLFLDVLARIHEQSSAIDSQLLKSSAFQCRTIVSNYLLDRNKPLLPGFPVLPISALFKEVALDLKNGMSKFDEGFIDASIVSLRSGYGALSLVKYNILGAFAFNKLADLIRAIQSGEKDVGKMVDDLNLVLSDQSIVKMNRQFTELEDVLVADDFCRNFPIIERTEELPVVFSEIPVLEPIIRKDDLEIINSLDSPFPSLTNIVLDDGFDVPFELATESQVAIDAVKEVASETEPAHLIEFPQITDLIEQASIEDVSIEQAQTEVVLSSSKIELVTDPLPIISAVDCVQKYGDDSPVDRLTDREIFDIFSEEAFGIFVDMEELRSRCESSGVLVHGDFDVLRRQWHTIKGSARMADLNLLGESAYLLEKSFSNLISSGQFSFDWLNASMKCADISRSHIERVDKSGFSELSIALFESAIIDSINVIKESTPDVPSLLIESLSISPIFAENVGVEVALIELEKNESYTNVDIIPSLSVTSEDPEDTPILGEIEVEDGIDPDVLAAFMTESVQIMSVIGSQIDLIRENGVSFELVMASHSMVGMSRIVECKGIQFLCESLEHWATHQYDTKAHSSEDALSVLNSLYIALNSSVLSFAPKSVEPDVSYGHALVAFCVAQTPSEVEIPVDVNAVNLASDSTALDLDIDFDLPEDVVSEAQIQVIVSDPIASISDVSNFDVLEISEVSNSVTPSHHGFSVNEAISDEIDKDILELFLPEADEIISEMDIRISEFIPGKSNFGEINRLLHTLKGGARICGLLRIGSILHKMEDSTMTGSAGLDHKDLISRVQSGLDDVRQMIKLIEGGVGGDKDKNASNASDVVDVTPLPVRSTSSSLRVSSNSLDSMADLLGRMKITQDRISRRTLDGLFMTESIRLPLDRILVIANSIALNAESEIDSGSKSKENASDGFDSLEMDKFSSLQENTRRLLEAVNDVSNIFENSEKILQDIGEASRQETELTTYVQLGLDSIGKSGILSVESRLRAAVRQAASDCSKSCDLLFFGDVRIERTVLEKLVPAIEHMLRNSVAHGIESEEVRKSLGKPRQGTISIESKRDGSYCVINISDDGSGVDFDRVKAKAKKLDLLNNSEPTEADLIEILFSAGFSTEENINNVSGRGVGLDVVRDSINRLSGRVSLKSIKGEGVSFLIKVPISHGYVSGILIESGSCPYIIPSSFVKGVEIISGQSLSFALETPGSMISTQDGDLKSLFGIGYLCGTQSHFKWGNYHQAIVSHGNPDSLILGERIEFINNMPLKYFQSGLIRNNWVIGHSLLSDGRVAIVVNPDNLIDGRTEFSAPASPSYMSQKTSPTVLIVDDSITVRTVTSKFLKKNGFNVETAENGAVALEKLAESSPSVILMDIEMPVMDGFEATKAIKANPEFADIPIAIISSRNADKHRTYALSIGASAFFGKPYKESDLLSWVEQQCRLDIDI